MAHDLPSNPRLLDVGCGPGAQTLELARLTGGRVAALDLYERYLAQLALSAEAAALRGQIDVVRGSMADLPFIDRSFDVVWAEGSIYIVGFEAGLRSWRRLIRPGGYLAVTHLSWLVEEIPEVPKQFWRENYPAIASVDHNLQLAARAGYRPIGQFTLPESAWWVDYYGPLEARLSMLRGDADLAQDADARRAMAATQREIDMYRAFSSVYGYVFYVFALEG